MDIMDLDHEMDLDVDLVPDEPIAPEPEPQDAANRSDGEVDDDANERAHSKVHITGLDVLNPTDVQSYVQEHYPDASYQKLEWIDDTSANLIFADGDTAARALEALAQDSIADPSLLPPRHLLSAKSYSAKPDVTLRVRPALMSDKKQVGAASRSRFYLLNPEYDPEERRRRNERRYRDRDGDSNYRRRRRDRDSDGGREFHVSMYDDGDSAPVESGGRRQRPYTPGSDSDRERFDRRDRDLRDLNRGKELFPDGSNRRRRSPRGRSASPGRDRDGDRDMDSSSREGSQAREAHDRNRDRARAIKSHMSRRNTRAKELFPEKDASNNGRLGDRVEDAADLLAKGITLPLMDGSSDVPAAPGQASHPRPGRLADRITNPGNAADSAFNIRGSASQVGANQGFAIKGNAGKSVRELFPDKFGSNAGRELFAADALGGRSKRRQKAGDLFD
ncbi:hypothetical protein F5Y15DRAFT_395501 [Xylariaceae sp. FL0016]|nr:hypothetical protein F5Y15DRAFT_395501 [Xylariaceae sp. FL0016]